MKINKNAVKAGHFRVLTALIGFFLTRFTAKSDNSLSNPGFEASNTSGRLPFGCTTSVVGAPNWGNYSRFASNRSGAWRGPSQSLLGLTTSYGQPCIVSGWARMDNASPADLAFDWLNRNNPSKQSARITGRRIQNLKGE